MTAKELRNNVVSRLWTFKTLPDNIATLMTDNEVDFMIEVINTKVQEDLIKKLEGEMKEYEEAINIARKSSIDDNLTGVVSILFAKHEALKTLKEKIK